jgi:hypothetical protein
MKKKMIIPLFALFLVMCKVKYEVKYDFPKEMLPHVKEQYSAQCEKGKILWDMNCARCHNTTVKKKVIVPDFKEAQLRGYELRVANAKHESNLPDSLVTEEELSIIMTFLRYKKRNDPAQ